MKKARLNIRYGEKSPGDIIDSVKEKNFDSLVLNGNATIVKDVELTKDNKELEKVRDELETANEKLQATTDELETANENLQAKKDELTTALAEKGELIAIVKEAIASNKGQVPKSFEKYQEVK